MSQHLKVHYSTNSLSLNKKNNSDSLKQLEDKKLEDELRLKNEIANFNLNIKAYVDVCCKSNKLVIYYSLH